MKHYGSLLKEAAKGDVSASSVKEQISDMGYKNFITLSFLNPRAALSILMGVYETSRRKSCPGR